MKERLPFILIYTRLAIGFLLIILSSIKISNYPSIAVSILLFGLLTDVFDGIIARGLNISSQRLRRLDSSIDQVFFISVGVATFLQCPAFFSENSMLLILLFIAEAATYAVSFLKFKKRNCYAQHWCKNLDLINCYNTYPGYGSMPFVPVVHCMFLGRDFNTPRNNRYFSIVEIMDKRCALHLSCMAIKK